MLPPLAPAMDPNAPEQLAPPEPSVPYDSGVDLRLRHLARRLVTDAGRADDVVQDVWCAAIGAPPPRAPEQWLRALTRRFAFRSNRDLERRAHLERDGARPEVAEESADPAEVARLGDVEHALLSALATVRGRRADVLRLRYSEGLKLREISERMGVPLGTIKADHALALRELRKRLAERFGSDRRWALALVPLASRGDQATLVGGGGALFGVLAGVAAAVLAAVGLVRGLEGCAPAAAASGASQALAAGGRGTGGDSDTPAEVRQPGSATAAADPTAAAAPTAVPTRAEATPLAAPSPELVSLEVAVTDGDGAPLTGGSVVLLGEDARHVAIADLDSAGVARVSLAPSQLAEPRRPGGAPVFGVIVRGVPRAVPHVYFFAHAPGVRRTIALATPELRLRGRVATAAGVPVVGATVVFDSATFLVEDLAPDCWRQRRIEKATTDAAGGFFAARLEPGVRALKITAPGFQTRHLDLPFETPGAFELPETIVLEPAAGLTGLVLDEAGAPVADAEVWLERGDDTTEREVARSDRNGAFQLHSAPRGAHVVWARAAGVDGGEPRTAELAVTIEADAANEARLELTGRPLGRLRLVDAEGAPLVGWMAYVVVPGIDPGKRPFTETLTTDAAGEVLVTRNPGLPLLAMVLDLGLERRNAQLPVHSELLAGPWEGVREVVVAHAHEPRGALVGRLVESDGTPYRQKLLLFAPDHDHSVFVAVRADGSFRLDGIPTGRYELMGERAWGTAFAFHIHHLAPGDTIEFGEVRLPTPNVGCDHDGGKGPAHEQQRGGPR